MRSEKSNTELSMTQLCEQSGFATRTVRTLIAAGLIPGAIGRGRAAYYTKEHLYGLEQIGPLKLQGISVRALATMRRVPGLARRNDPSAVERDTLGRLSLGGFIQILVDRTSSQLTSIEERELLDRMSSAAQQYLKARARKTSVARRV